MVVGKPAVECTERSLLRRCSHLMMRLLLHV